MENDRVFADILNNCLDAVDAGQASIEDCIARHPQHAARLEELLSLGSEVRTVPLLTPTPGMLAAGERRLVQAARSKAVKGRSKQQGKSLFQMWPRRLIEPVKIKMGALPRGLFPVLAVSGSLILLFACLVVVLLGAGTAWRSFRNKDARLDSPTMVLSERKEGTRVSPLPTPTLTTSIAQNVTPLPSPTGVPAPDSSPGLTHTVYLPFSVSPIPPQVAMLENIQGVVSVQTDGVTWIAASVDQMIEPGQRVRTGALSSASLAFYDGSIAHLGPGTEISVDQLGQDPSDQSRIVELSQWLGETDHDVAPASGENARYEVHTPTGTGEAMGTSFHVLVSPARFTRFSVDRGTVAVTHLNVTVIVLPGQLTTIPVDQPPSKPVFRVTGEGQVTRIGPDWEIAGHVFSTHGHTVIVGNPQVGDWVSVDGHLSPDGTQVADRIVLLHRAPQNRFTITGQVETLQDTEWTVAGQAISVTEETRIEGNVESGDLVRVEGVIRQDGTLVAERIRLIDTEPGLPFRFVGVVQDRTDRAWTISGISIAIEARTEVDAGLEVGDVVEVRGWILEDDTWLARSIERVTEQIGEFEFTGSVESIAPWRVSGISFETSEWTEIEAGIAIGDAVKVEGMILPDGTRVATEIELLEDSRSLRFEFVGLVQNTNPWRVGGISLVVDRQTKIKGHIVAGMWVKVEGRILPDGTWLVTEIKPAFRARPGRGCLTISVVVVGASPDRLQLRNWPSIDLDDDILVDGEIAVGSILLLQICVGDDGTIDVVRIIVILPPPPPPPPMPPSPCGPCRGGATNLTLRYVGSTANAHIQVLQKKQGIVFDGMVQPGGTLTFGGTGKNGKLDKEIAIVVNGQVNTKIHTSCSKPIAPGIVIGDFQVVAGYSKEGGPFCPEPMPGASPSKDGRKDGSKGGTKGGSKDGSKGGSR